MIVPLPIRFFPFRRGILAFSNDISYKEGQRATPSERDLIRRLARNDPDAAAEMVRGYADIVYRFIYHQVGGVTEDAEDLTQETFLAALQSAHRFRGNSRLRTWLLRIAAHKIADHWRSRYRQPSQFPLEDWHATMDEDASPPTFLEETEVRDRVRAALLTLPPHYRTALVLRYVEDMPVTEIAQVMERSPKSVESILIRAKQMLSRNLRGTDDR
ncbi:MAG: RNA polymerase sigma factor [Anaerolineae bacterium]